MIGAGEKAGSGILKITHAWEEQDWRRPSITEDHELNETELYLSLISLYPEEVVGRLTSSLGDAFTSLDKTERAVLVAVAAEGSAQHGDILGIVGGHSRDLTMTLQALLRKELLSQDRPGRGCSYSVLPELDLGREPPEPSPWMDSKRTDPASVVIEYVREHGMIKRGEVMKACQVNGDQATRLLKKMTGRGLLQRHGSRRWTYYTPGPKIEVESR